MQKKIFDIEPPTIIVGMLCALCNSSRFDATLGEAGACCSSNDRLEINFRRGGINRPCGGTQPRARLIPGESGFVSGFGTSRYNEGPA